MKQIATIYWKDVRHYWLEGGASLALVVAFGWVEMHAWLRDGYLVAGDAGLTAEAGNFGSRFLPSAIVVLLPVVWAFVAVRVVQGESLVGDRQFWVTRPYEWKKLLAAKVLFILTFVNLPLMVLDVFLLAKAGFAPLKHIAGLLWMQWMILLYFMLPVVALATVTATLVQMLLAVLMIALYASGMAVLSGQIPSSSFSGPADSLSGFLFIGVCLAVILLQYARRKRARAQTLIVGLAGALLLILVATPYRTIVEYEFPQLTSGQPPPFQFALLPAEKPESKSVFASEKEIEIQLPLSASGLPSESMVNMDGVMVEIEAPDSFRWNSGWISRGLSVFPEEKSTNIAFTLKRNIFERLKASSVKARISFAFTLFHDANRRAFVTPRGAFSMSEVGLCSTGSIFFRGLHCLAPLRRPSSLLISADMSATTCPVLRGESRAQPGEIAREWIRNGEAEPAELGISPVKSVELYLYRSSSGHTSGICPGTPLVLSNPEPVGHNRATMQIENLQLTDYRVPSQFDDGSVSFGVVLK